MELPNCAYLVLDVLQDMAAIDDVEELRRVPNLKTPGNIGTPSHGSGSASPYPGSGFP